jgi:hypothetical protein
VEHAAKLMSEKQVGVSDRQSRQRLVGIVALGDIAVDRSEIQPAAEALAKISESS